MSLLEETRLKFCNQWKILFTDTKNLISNISQRIAQLNKTENTEKPFDINFDEIVNEKIIPRFNSVMNLFSQVSISNSKKDIDKFEISALHQLDEILLLHETLHDEVKDYSNATSEHELREKRLLIRSLNNLKDKLNQWLESIEKETQDSRNIDNQSEKILEEELHSESSPKNVVNIYHELFDDDVKFPKSKLSKEIKANSDLDGSSLGSALSIGSSTVIKAETGRKVGTQNASPLSPITPISSKDNSPSRDTSLKSLYPLSLSKSGRKALESTYQDSEFSFDLPNDGDDDDDHGNCKSFVKLSFDKSYRDQIEKIVAVIHKHLSGIKIEWSDDIQNITDQHLESLKSEKEKVVPITSFIQTETSSQEDKNISKDKPSSLPQKASNETADNAGSQVTNSDLQESTPPPLPPKDPSRRLRSPKESTMQNFAEKNQKREKKTAIAPKRTSSIAPEPRDKTRLAFFPRVLQPMLSGEPKMEISAPVSAEHVRHIEHNKLTGEFSLKNTRVPLKKIDRNQSAI